MNDIIVAIITGGLSALCSVVAIIISNEKNNALQDERIKTMKDEIAKLADHVEKHNNYGLEIREIKTRLSILERK